MTPEEFVGEVGGVDGLVRLGLSREQAFEVRGSTQWISYIQGSSGVPVGVQLVLYSRTRVSVARLIPPNAHGFQIEVWIGGKQVTPKKEVMES